MSIAFSVSLGFILFLCGVVTTILLFVHRGPRLPSRLLVAFNGVLILVLGHALLLNTGWILQVPHAFRLNAPLDYLLGPLAYLYVRSVLKREDRLRWSDAWHALPFLLHSLELMPFIMQSAATKEAYLAALMTDKSQIPRFTEGLLPPYGHLLLKSGLVLGYALFQMRLVRQAWKRDCKDPMPSTKVPKATLSWLGIFSGILIVNSGAYLIAGSLPGMMGSILFYLLNGLVGILVFSVLIVILFFPHVLYGFPVWLFDSEKPSYASSLLEESEVERNVNTVEQVLRETKPFLNTQYSLPDLVRDTGISRHRLSATINEGLSMNFNELINQYRVRYAVEDLSPEKWKTLSIEGIGTECGFHSRTTFTRAFKKEMGMTPSDFRQKRLKATQ